MDIEIKKFKVRRGTDETRRQVVLDQGELGATTDTRRLYLGDGATPGGVVIGAKIHAPLATVSGLSTLNAEVGDLVRANGKVYRLFATNSYAISSWELFSQEIDDLYITNTGGTLTIGNDSIDSTKLNVDSLTSSSVTFDSYTGPAKLVVNYNTSTFTISSNQLALNTGGVNEIHINSGSFAPGLSGGSGNKVGVDVDGVTLGFTGNKLTVLSTPVTALGVQNLSAGFNTTYVGSTPVVNTNLTNIDSQYFSLCAGGIVSLIDRNVSSNIELPMFDVDDAGIIKGVTSTIFDILTCNAVGSPFYGSPDQILSGYPLAEFGPGGHSEFTAASANVTPGMPATYITLSSAGFITFEGGMTVRNGERRVGRFAIPVFTF